LEVVLTLPRTYFTPSLEKFNNVIVMLIALDSSTKIKQVSTNLFTIVLWLYKKNIFVFSLSYNEKSI